MLQSLHITSKSAAKPAICKFRLLGKKAGIHQKYWEKQPGLSTAPIHLATMLQTCLGPAWHRCKYYTAVLVYMRILLGHWCFPAEKKTTSRGLYHKPTE